MKLDARRWIIPIVAVVLLQAGFILLYRGFSGRPAAGSRPEPLRVGDPAPAIPLVRGDGSSTTVTQFGRGPLIVHFWATWCEPCRKELPSLLAFGKTPEAVPVVAVSVDHEWDAVRDFFGGPVPENVARAESAGQTAYGGSMLPVSYLLDGQHRLVATFEGARDWNAPSLRAHIGRLAHGK